MDLDLFISRGPKRVFDQLGLKGVETNIFSLLVKVPVVDNTADTPNPLGIYPL